MIVNLLICFGSILSTMRNAGPYLGISEPKAKIKIGTYFFFKKRKEMTEAYVIMLI